MWDSKSSPLFPQEFYSTNISITIGFTSDYEVGSKGFRIGVDFEFVG